MIWIMLVKWEEMNFARVVGDLDHIGKGAVEPCQTGR